MEPNSIIETITAIKFESPVDKIIRQLKQLISSGQLKPGDRLPAERILAERLGVGRGYVREAIMKLEFFGLLKTSPQSGTYVAGLSIKILDSLLGDVINLNKDDFGALIEARYYMELNAVKLAAERRTDSDIADLENALLDHEKKAANGLNAFEEDMIFHMKIAAATKNQVIESMMLIVVPDLIRTIVEKKVCGTDRSSRAVAEHKNILDSIILGDTAAAEAAMKMHLDEIMKVRLDYKDTE
jgi:GntR family transcriptional regulator, transcriptional repressor for pyruvate dehydrogenase complex